MTTFTEIHFPVGMLDVVHIKINKNKSYYIQCNVSVKMVNNSLFWILGREQKKHLPRCQGTSCRFYRSHTHTSFNHLQQQQQQKNDTDEEAEFNKVQHR